MSNTAKAQEPTMEEILASIRRIIADDTPPVPAATLDIKSRLAAGPQPVAPARPVPVRLAPEPEPEPEPDHALDQENVDALFATDGDGSPVDGHSPDEDVLELTDDMSEVEAAELDHDGWGAAEEGPRIGAPAPVEPPDVVFETAPEPEPRAKAPPPPPPARPAQPVTGQAVDRLLSPEADAAVSSAFGSLAQTMLTGNARTIEDLVQEMLRPMLKSWLDDNLPAIVERMVRAEIDRVSRGR